MKWGVSKHGVKDVGLATGEADECGVLPLALGSPSVVVGPGFEVGWDGRERAIEQGALQSLSTDTVDMLAATVCVRSPGDRRESRVGREVRSRRRGVRLRRRQSRLDPCVDAIADYQHLRRGFGRKVGTEDPADVLGDLPALIAQLRDQGSDLRQDPGSGPDRRPVVAADRASHRGARGRRTHGPSTHRSDRIKFRYGLQAHAVPWMRIDPHVPATYRG